MIFSFRRRGRLFVKRRAAKVFLTLEPILFYMFVSAAFEVAAFVLLPQNLRGYIHGISIFLSLVLSTFLTITSYKKRKTKSERIYIEHLTYLFCKNNDFKKSLFDIREIFQGKEERKVINTAIFAAEKYNVKKAMEQIETYFSGSNVKMLHRYILESRCRQNYHPPAEILTIINTNSDVNLRTVSEKRKDRGTIFLCSLISMCVCVILEVLEKSQGFLNSNYDSAYPKLFSFFVFAIVFAFYEVSEELRTDNFGSEYTVKVCMYLKKLTYFLLVMPVPKAITKSVEYLDWTMRRKVSKLAVCADTSNTSEEYLAFGEKTENEKLIKIMGFLFAKSEEPYLVPYELTAMLRQLDEVLAAHATKSRLEERKKRTNLLLMPQFATFVILFGNILTLFGSLGDKL